MYTVSQKVPNFKLSVTLSNLNRFSKYLHCLKAYTVAAAAFEVWAGGNKVNSHTGSGLSQLLSQIHVEIMYSGILCYVTQTYIEHALHLEEGRVGEGP